MRIRPADLHDAPAIAAVQVDTWRASYAGLIAADYLAELSSEKRAASWARILAPANASLAYVAETPAGEVVGFVSAGPEREADPLYPGEIYALYLLPAYQRRGLGRKLFSAAASELQQRGWFALRLWVLAANPARGFYEALGGRYLGQMEVEIGAQRLIEVAYGWKDTRN